MRRLYERVVTVTTTVPGESGLRTYSEICGKSTETKPVGTFVSGSIFVEIDTGNVFLYDEDTNTWVEQFSLQG